MDRQELYQTLFEQQKEFLEADQRLVKRDAEEEVVALMKAKMPIIIVGVRRCGKSTLLKLLKERLNLNAKGFLYVNFNDERLLRFDYLDFQKITDYIQEQSYSPGCILFLDEVQESKNWEKWIDRIKDKHKIFITGSNSKLLSSEISTILTGRAVTLAVYPFSFREFLAARGVDTKDIRLDQQTQAKARILLDEYLEFGGFPKRVTTRQNIILSELYENITYRDVLSRFNSRQSLQIKEAMQFMLANMSRPLSTRGLSASSGIKNLMTIKKLMDTIVGAFLFIPISRFNFSIRKQIQNPKKMYCIDNGLITTSGFRTSPDYGRLLENCVLVELKRRKNGVYYYKNTRECDFVIRRGTKICQAIQVCYELNRENREREISGLLEAIKTYKLSGGIIITRDQDEQIRLNGKNIRIVPAWKWLI